MKQFYSYCIIFSLALWLSGCVNPLKVKKQKWNVTLKKEDKSPYGTYLAYQSLKYYFPESKFDSLSHWFHYNNIDYGMINQDGPALMIMVGLDFYISEKEMLKILQFANQGNEVIIFSGKLDYKIQALLHCYKQVAGYEEYPLGSFNPGKGNQDILNLGSHPHRWYGFNGRSLQSYFYLDNTTSGTDSAGFAFSENSYAADSIYARITPDTLGMMKNYPNFLRYKVGAGHITLHAAPLVLSNYFLLQEGNKNYLDGIWQTLPNNITKIYWNEYYKHTADSSDLGVLMRYPAMHWALWLAVIAMLIYILFEGKRRQRIIPTIAPVSNTSVSFVETVGRLYYNKADHSNMAEKMVQHFLEWIRSHYFLNTNELNDNFIKQLAMKSGKTENQVRFLIEMVHEVRLRQVHIDEVYLFQLYNTIQDFYKK